MYELWRDHDVNAESSGVGAVRLIMRFSSVVTLSSKNHFQLLSTTKRQPYFIFFCEIRKEGPPILVTLLHLQNYEFHSMLSLSMTAEILKEILISTGFLWLST